MRHLTASIPNASPRVLRTTLTAAAFAAIFVLLVLLPASGQSTSGRTDGKIGSGGLSVGVFNDIADAQLEKNLKTTYVDEAGGRTTVLPPTAQPDAHPGEYAERAPRGRLGVPRGREIRAATNILH